MSFFLAFFILYHASLSLSMSPFNLSIYPNDPQQFRNAYFWGVNASCQAYSSRSANLKIENTYGSLNIDDQWIDCGDNYTLAVDNSSPQFQIYITGASIVTFYDFGQQYIDIECECFMASKRKLILQESIQQSFDLPTNDPLALKSPFSIETKFLCLVVCEDANELIVKGDYGQFLLNGELFLKGTTKAFQVENDMEITLDAYPFAQITITNYGNNVIEFTCSFEESA